VKTKENNASVKEFLDAVKNETRRNDGRVLLKMMQAATGKKPTMWGSSIIGFDNYFYQYADGRTGEIGMLGFSPRAQNLALYVGTQFDGAETLLATLGKHKFGAGGCLYINKLADVDLRVLEKLFSAAYTDAKQRQQKAGYG